MKNLDENWIFNKTIDFEYKQYILLAYLQQVNRSFNNMELYPALKDLIQHYLNAKQLKDKFNNLSKKFPTTIKSINLNELQIQQESIFQNSKLVDELMEILDFSIPQLQNHVEKGKSIFDQIEDEVELFPIGITPLNNDAGYIFLKNQQDSNTHVFEYQLSIYQTATDKLRGIHTKYTTSYVSSISNTYENIKHELIKSNKNLPNPATYVVESKIKLPMKSTYLPIAKRLLVKYITLKSK